MPRKKKTFNGVMRTVSTIVALLVVFATLVAGTIETRVRVSNNEQDIEKAEHHYERSRAQLDRRFKEIQEILKEIQINTALLAQRLEDIVDGRKKQ